MCQKKVGMGRLSPNGSCHWPLDFYQLVRLVLVGRVRRIFHMAKIFRTVDKVKRFPARPGTTRLKSSCPTASLKVLSSTTDTTINIRTNQHHVLDKHRSMASAVLPCH